MNLYRFGDNPKFFTLLIEEDNGEMRVTTVGIKNVIEHIAREYVTKDGYIRLTYAGGSSIPYKNPDGTMSNKWTKINL